MLNTQPINEIETMTTTISEDVVDTTYCNGPFARSEAKSQMSKLRRSGIHAWTIRSGDADAWRTCPLYVLHRLPTIQL